MFIPEGETNDNGTHKYLHSDWLFQILQLNDWLIKIVLLEIQNSTIYAELIMSGTSQIAGINSDFRMDIIKKNRMISEINIVGRYFIKLPVT